MMMNSKKGKNCEICGDPLSWCDPPDDYPCYDAKKNRGYHLRCLKLKNIVNR